MLRGGPPVTLGLSPRTRSYSRMLTLAKETLRRKPRVVEPAVALSASLAKVFLLDDDRLLWSDSFRVLEVRMLRGLTSSGRRRVVEEGGVRIRMVGAELVMVVLRKSSLFLESELLLLMLMLLLLVVVTGFGPLDILDNNLPFLPENRLEDEAAAAVGGIRSAITSAAAAAAAGGGGALESSILLIPSDAVDDVDD